MNGHNVLKLLDLVNSVIKRSEEGVKSINQEKNRIHKTNKYWGSNKYVEVKRLAENRKEWRIVWNQLTDRWIKKN